MPYVSIKLSGGKDARVPQEHAEDDARRHAHEWLLQLAWPHYNRALRAERNGQIPKALSAARLAARYGIYSPRVLKATFLISAKHGDFEVAERILAQLRKLGLDEDRTFSSLLETRVERWNLALKETGTLRKRYQQEDAASSYRELLLLVDRLKEVPTETEKTHLSVFGLVAEAPAEEARRQDRKKRLDKKKRVRSLSAWIAIAGVVGALIGGGSFYFGPLGEIGQAGKTQATSTRQFSLSDSLVKESQYDAVARASQHLAEGNSVDAYQVLGRADETGGGRIDSLRASTREALYREGVRAWKNEDYRQVVRALELIQDKPVGPAQQRLYFLGVAAAQTGHSDLAVEVLSNLMPKIDEQHPHYEAQAAYLLAKLSPPETARRYARLVAEEHGDTIYYNSVVRDRLGN
ncbi:hypothetical protein [Salinibacter ruber]|uniref:hypothetical protein n=1 Tax=Salinibacter ruber TaxID=146919 RepID=UPI0021682FE7|nr:hypothetical protein [Salinibacter ruber]MCS4056824.1 hypothetical protein [Salinibacter ruber]